MEPPKSGPINRSQRVLNLVNGPEELPHSQSEVYYIAYHCLARLALLKYIRPTVYIYAAVYSQTHSLSRTKNVIRLKKRNARSSKWVAIFFHPQWGI